MSQTATTAAPVNGEQQAVYYKRPAFGIATAILFISVGLAFVPGQELSSLLVTMLAAVIAVMGFVDHKPKIAWAALTLMMVTGNYFYDGSAASFVWAIVSHNIHGYELALFLASIIGWVGFAKATGLIDVFGSRLVYAAEKSGSPILLGFSLAAMSSTLTTWMDEISGVGYAKDLGMQLAAVGTDEAGELIIDAESYRKHMWLAVMFGNLTSCATLVANPVTAAAALKFDLTFLGFVLWIWPILIVSWISGFLYIVIFRKTEILMHIYRTTLKYHEDKKPMERKHWLVLASMALFALMMSLSGRIDELFGLPHNAAFLATPFIFATSGYIVTVIERQGNDKHIRKDVREETPTILTILALTFMVTIIEEFGFKKLAADMILGFASWIPYVSDTTGMYITLTIFGVIITSIYDNVVAMLSLGGVILTLALPLPEEARLAFTTVFICTAGAQLLPIGSVGGLQTQIALRRFKVAFDIPEWFRMGAPFLVCTLFPGLAMGFFLHGGYVSLEWTIR